jgi:hypothetical protein
MLWTCATMVDTDTCDKKARLAARWGHWLGQSARQIRARAGWSRRILEEVDRAERTEQGAPRYASYFERPESGTKALVSRW